MQQQNDKLMVSVLGDSISTYEDFIPGNYIAYFSGEILKKNGMTSVNDMWWAKVNQHLDTDICVCNAYSGSRVSGYKFPSMSCDVRTSFLHKDECFPDIVLIYAGMNDFGFREPIENNFERSYHKMLQKIRKNYPDALVFCGTIMKSYIRDKPTWSFPEYLGESSLNNYNSTIREAAVQEGCILADLASLQVKYETLDGTHPTAKGHTEIAECWNRVLDSAFAVLKIKSKFNFDK